MYSCSSHNLTSILLSVITIHQDAVLLVVITILTPALYVKQQLYFLNERGSKLSIIILGYLNKLQKQDVLLQ